MKLITLKIKPIIHELYCDCGERITDIDYEETVRQHILNNVENKKVYICKKCGKKCMLDSKVNIISYDYKKLSIKNIEELQVAKSGSN